MKRFDEIVIGAAVESGDPIGHSVARGDNQHWDRVVLFAALHQKGHSVFSGQPQVEQHDRVRPTFQGEFARLAIAHPIDAKAFHL